MKRVDGLFEPWSMPYVFPHEETFALVVGALIIGLLLFRFGLARRREGRADHSE